MDSAVSELENGVLAIVAFGGNVPFGGAPTRRVFEMALARFPGHGLHLVKQSGLWRSAAWPDPADPPFLNGVALVRTTLAPREAMDALHEIEHAFGRRRSEPNAPRTLDLALIAYGDLVGDVDGVALPHPRAADRLFVMGPLAEIAPAWRHPVSHRTAAELGEAATVGRDAAAE